LLVGNSPKHSAANGQNEALPPVLKAVATIRSERFHPDYKDELMATASLDVSGNLQAIVAEGVQSPFPE